ncbi:MAG: hypothetical protein LUE61_03035 [Clostridiales bacterium]|nr:hypothetical protein [Clostridiales bacterium]
MFTIFQDMAATARLFPIVREARRSGACECLVQPVFPVKERLNRGASWYDTMEGCLLAYNADTERQVHAVFLTFPPELREKLACSPERPGEWAERLRFWTAALKPALPADTYLDAVLQFSAWYRHCIYLRHCSAARET